MPEREPAGTSGSAYVAGVGTALPGPALRQQDVWAARFAAHFAADRAARRIFLGAGVHRRHAAVNPMVEDVSGWSTGARMRRYLTEALPLGKDAVGAALADAGLRAEDVGQFTVASCTGYATPGLDIRIAADLGMAASVQRLAVGHMGCYAAVPGLGAVTDYVVSRRRPGGAAVLRAHVAARAAAHRRPRAGGLARPVRGRGRSRRGDAGAARPGARPCGWSTSPRSPIRPPPTT